MCVCQAGLAPVFPGCGVELIDAANGTRLLAGLVGQIKEAGGEGATQGFWLASHVGVLVYLEAEE